MKWSKLYAPNFATTNTASANQILSYNSANDGTMTWITNTASISDDSIT